MESLENWINSIKYKANNSSDEKVYKIGTTFDQVLYNQAYSLKDFFDEMKSFFNQPMHMIYSSDEPTNKNIKV